jgi:hypothetical protein
MTAKRKIKLEDLQRGGFSIETNIFTGEKELRRDGQTFGIIVFPLPKRRPTK